MFSILLLSPLGVQNWMECVMEVVGHYKNFITHELDVVDKLWSSCSDFFGWTFSLIAVCSASEFVFLGKNLFFQTAQSLASKNLKMLSTFWN